ncbi:MAG: tRNA (cytidine(56)-2'-O)-methyltransferase [Euryarchaeota archaeon]|nr:tRNA (cytidine(56)-2'-O)-methyltransferase [Euryarchaeota archaeon]
MIAVLRMGHRPQRDKRITTHVCLVARALGADGVFLWRKDVKIKETVENVVKSWGGEFFMRFKSYKTVLREWDGVIVHLTMYGEKLDKINEIRRKTRDKDLLVVVGAEKVPRLVYEKADYNISIGSQPHSEVAALAVFLDRFFEGKTLYRKFDDAVLRIEPSAAGKIVREKDFK